MGYTHFDKVSGVTGIGIGKKGSEVLIAKPTTATGSPLVTPQRKSVTSLADANATLTAAQLLNSGIFTMNPTAARTITTPNATDVINAIGGAVGDSIEFAIVNLNATNAITVAAGTGVTMVGSATVAAGASGTYLYVITGSTTASCVRI